MSRHFATIDRNLPLLDLNRPSFGTMTYTSILDSLFEEFPEDGKPLNLFGSSMGGYLSSRWAELRPKQINKMLLMCPAFDLVGRWPALMGDEAFANWESDGFAYFEDRFGKLTPLHWEFVVDARKHTRTPEFDHETVIVHGVNDDVVPIDLSRAVAQERDNVTLIEVEDDHFLAHSMDTIWGAARDLFGL